MGDGVCVGDSLTSFVKLLTSVERSTFQAWGRSARHLLTKDEVGYKNHRSQKIRMSKSENSVVVKSMGFVSAQRSELGQGCGGAGYLFMPGHVMSHHIIYHMSYISYQIMRKETTFNLCTF